jgi:hypothetical protein
VDLLLAGLMPLALQGAPGLLGNLLALRIPRNLFSITWMSMLVGTGAEPPGRSKLMYSCNLHTTAPLGANHCAKDKRGRSSFPE